MTPEQIEIERKAFEAWVQSELNYGYDLAPGFGGQAYAHDPTDNMWMAWEARAEKAERVREALEEVLAAQDAWEAYIDRFHNGTDVNPDGPEGKRLEVAWEAARAALKEDTHG